MESPESLQLAALTSCVYGMLILILGFNDVPKLAFAIIGLAGVVAAFLVLVYGKFSKREVTA